MAKESAVGLEQVQLAQPRVTIGKNDILQVIQTLKEKNPVWRLTQNKAETGNKLLLTLIQPLGDESIEIILGKEHQFSDVEGKLLGCQIGNKLKLCGNQIIVAGVFIATLIEKESQLALLLGCDNEVELYQHVETSMKQELKKAIRNFVKRSLYDQVIAHFTDSQKTTEDDSREALLENALNNMLRQHPISLDEKRVAGTLRAVANRTEKKIAKKIAKEDTGLYLKISAAVLESQITEQILKYAEISNYKMSYQDFTLQYKPEFSDPVVKLSRDKKCSFCGTRKCCTYITQKIPKPRSKSDFEHLLWQVSHENIQVYQDSDGWYLMIDTQCSHLQENGDCGIYMSRPKICRKYKNSFCEFDFSGTDHYKQCFNSYESLLEYCQTKF